MRVICGWCGKWLKGQPTDGDEPISHGIYRTCADLLLKEARKGGNRSTKPNSDKGPVEKSIHSQTHFKRICSG